MLIGCCGAGGTGKTTTAKALAQNLGLPFIASSSRAVFERRGLKEADQWRLSATEQFDLQQEIFQAREQLEAQIEGGVADRTLFDQVAYNLLRAGPVITEPILDDMLSRAKASLRKYQFVFYFPLVTFETSNDGMRDTAFGVRVQFDAILTWVLKEAGVFTPRVPLMRPDERVQWMKGVMS